MGDFHTTEEIQAELLLNGLPYKPCGLNADWSVQAWHLSEGRPNFDGKEGGVYLLDCEERCSDEEDAPWAFSVVLRKGDPEIDENDEFTVLVDRATLEDACGCAARFKACSTCKVVHSTMAWARLPLLGRMEQRGSESELEMRNCACGSTLAVEVLP